VNGPGREVFMCHGQFSIRKAAFEDFNSAGTSEQILSYGASGSYPSVMMLPDRVFPQSPHKVPVGVHLRFSTAWAVDELPRPTGLERS
jgi:hypothetical protein